MASLDDSSCPLCYEDYNNDVEGRIPRNLTCGHTYCTECMKGLQSATRDTEALSDMFAIDSGVVDRGAIQCPTCKKVTNIRSGLHTDLPKNYSLLGLLEKLKKTNETVEQEKRFKCPDHKDENLRYRCRSPCSTLVCGTCLLEGKHNGHKYDNISSLTKEMAQNVREELKAVKEDKQRLEGGLANVNRVIERVQTTSKQSKEKIKERFEKLRSCLSRRETKLLEELEEYISNHLETLESQKSCLEEYIEMTKKKFEKGEKILAGPEVDLLTEARSIADELLALQQGLDSLAVDPLVSPEIRFKIQPNIVDEINHLGKLELHDAPPPSHTPPQASPNKVALEADLPQKQKLTPEETCRYSEPPDTKDLDYHEPSTPHSRHASVEETDFSAALSRDPLNRSTYQPSWFPDVRDDPAAQKKVSIPAKEPTRVVLFQKERKHDQDISWGERVEALRSKYPDRNDEESVSDLETSTPLHSKGYHSRDLWAAAAQEKRYFSHLKD